MNSYDLAKLWFESCDAERPRDGSFPPLAACRLRRNGASEMKAVRTRIIG